jgi:hypothetical protein
VGAAAPHRRVAAAVDGLLSIREVARGAPCGVPVAVERLVLTGDVAAGAELTVERLSRPVTGVSVCGVPSSACTVPPGDAYVTPERSPSHVAWICPIIPAFVNIWLLLTRSTWCR